MGDGPTSIDPSRVACFILLRCYWQYLLITWWVFGRLVHGGMASCSNITAAAMLGSTIFGWVAGLWQNCSAPAVLLSPKRL